jgi:hypothetical protein
MEIYTCAEEERSRAISRRGSASVPSEKRIALRFWYFALFCPEFLGRYFCGRSRSIEGQCGPVEHPVWWRLLHKNYPIT